MQRQVRDLTQEGSVRRFEMWWAPAGSEAQRVATAELEEGQGIDDVATEFWEAAENDAATRAEGIPQRYTVGVFRGDAPDPTGQHAFLVTAQSPAGHFAMKSMEASAAEVDKMAVNQQIRHTETLHRMLLEQTHHTNGYLAAELQKERAQSSRLQEQLLSLFQAAQDLEDRKADRELERAKAQAVERRHQQIMGLVMTAAPVLLAQFLGGNALPGAAVARDAGIAKFLKNLTEPEIKGVISSLKPENQMALLEVYKAYQSESKEEDKELHPYLREEEPDIH
jgi:hypothetical protein